MAYPPEIFPLIPKMKLYIWNEMLYIFQPAHHFVDAFPFPLNGGAFSGSFRRLFFEGFNSQMLHVWIIYLH